MGRPNLKNEVAPDQIALEKQFKVTVFPTIMVLRPFKTGQDGKGNSHYDFHETARCAVGRHGDCTNLIVSAVRYGQ